MEGAPELDQRFQSLLKAYGAALRRLCAAYSRDPSEREDLFQDIAIALWRALPRFRGAASERTWLYRIAHNVALGHMRGRLRQSSREAALSENLRDPVHGPDDRKEELLSAVRSLPDVDRELATLYLEGLTAEEISDIVGLTSNNVAVRLHRARRKLAQMLRPVGDSHE